MAAENPRHAGSEPQALPRQAAVAIETPSGKTSGDENFPVGSWLLPARLRPHVAAFYAFARAADDIADNGALSPSEKLERLDLFEQALLGRIADSAAVEKAIRLRRSLAETGVTPQHGVDLLAAFKQDAVKSRYRDWDDLMGYCFKSAAPVGRYLLDLHGDGARGYEASDALCNALQIINHLQDCRDDYLNLDRVYVPLDWMAATGCGVEHLAAKACSPALRKVLDRVLDGVGDLLRVARRLPGGLGNRRLAMESAVIVAIAERLTAKLRNEDPLAGRVALSKPAMLACALGGLLRLWRGA